MERKRVEIVYLTSIIPRSSEVYTSSIKSITDKSRAETLKIIKNRLGIDAEFIEEGDDTFLSCSSYNGNKKYHVYDSLFLVDNKICISPAVGFNTISIYNASYSNEYDIYLATDFINYFENFPHIKSYKCNEKNNVNDGKGFVITYDNEDREYINDTGVIIVRKSDNTIHPMWLYQIDDSNDNINKTIKLNKESKTMIVKNDKFTQNYTRVECEDKEDQKFNAPHHYKVIDINNDKVVAEVNFQEGPIKENGINGMSNEDGILMVIDRLEHFQNSDWKCEENTEAIEYFYKGIDALRRRTNKRVERGVEGTSEK